MIEHFDNFGIAVSSRDSQKRKELLIAYNELNSFLVSSLPLIATKAQIKHGIINEGEAELAISSSDITNMIYAKFGISQTKSGELIPVSEETNALTSKQVKYVLAHNTIIKQTNELRTVRLYSMENQRLKLGLAPSKKLFA
ncbi:hypothetical protein LMH73_009135 [Vibrio splendidus]|nr:hypothetical protein [Vibrio splendidus]MCC4880312.1 hypothetical protein [Vibrio splendidus]